MNCGGCGEVCEQECWSGTCCDYNCGPCQAVLLIGTLPTGDPDFLASLQSPVPYAPDPIGQLCRVDYFDANGGSTPTAAYLSQYEAVLAYNADNYPYADPGGLGNALAEYFDNGGRVVIALFADGGYPIGGAFQNYLLLTPSSAVEANDSFSVLVPTQEPPPLSPVVAGVTSISGMGWRGNQAVQNGGIAVASWASGAPLVVVGTVTDGNGNARNIVDLNIQPTDIATGAWTGDGIQLLRNALLYQ